MFWYNFIGGVMFDDSLNIVDVVSSMSSFLLLKDCGIKNNIICLPLCLAIGNLNDDCIFNRDILKKYNSSLNNTNFISEFDNLKKLVENDFLIRVWTSHYDVNDYCLLLLICNLFSDKNISVIFVDDLDSNLESLSCCSKSEVEKLKNMGHVLLKKEILEYSNEWKNVINNNKELRYMSDGNVLSCDIDLFDRDIIKRLDGVGKIYIYKFVADLLTNPILPHLRYPDFLYIYLTNRLENMNIVNSYIIDNKRYIDSY